MTTNQLRESLLFKDNTTTTTITLLQTINGRAIHCGNYKLLFISMYYHSIAVLLQTILLLFLLTQAKLLGREMYAIDKKTWSLLCRVASSLMHEILKQSGLNRYLLQGTGSFTQFGFRFVLFTREICLKTYLSRVTSTNIDQAKY